MVGADGSTELWRHPITGLFVPIASFYFIQTYLSDLSPFFFTHTLLYLSISHLPSVSVCFSLCYFALLFRTYLQCLFVFRSA